jgi:DNA-binding NarL/FixJ family response regulator
LTLLTTDELVFEAISAGAHAYLLKIQTEAEITETISASYRSIRGCRQKFQEKSGTNVADSGHRVCIAPLNERRNRRRTATEPEEKSCACAKGKANKDSCRSSLFAEGTGKNMSARLWKN